MANPDWPAERFKVGETKALASARANIHGAHGLADFFRAIAQAMGVPGEDLEFMFSMPVHNKSNARLAGQPIPESAFESTLPGVPDELRWKLIDAANLVGRPFTCTPIGGLRVDVEPTHGAAWMVSLEITDTSDPVAIRRVLMKLFFTGEPRSYTYDGPPEFDNIP